MKSETSQWRWKIFGNIVYMNFELAKICITTTFIVAAVLPFAVYADRFYSGYEHARNLLHMTFVYCMNQSPGHRTFGFP